MTHRKEGGVSTALTFATGDDQETYMGSARDFIYVVVLSTDMELIECHEEVS